MAQITQPSPAEIQAMYRAQNARAHAFVLGTGVRVIQPMPSQTVDLSRSWKYETNPANVGLVEGYLLEIEAEVKNSHATEKATISETGAANLLRFAEYFDPANNPHFATSGRHIRQTNAINNGSYLFDLTGEDNFNTVLEPVEIPAGQTRKVRIQLWLPLARGRNDLTGAVLANVANSQQRLNLTFSRKDEAFVATGASEVDAVYVGGTLDFESFKFTVYQQYFDQLKICQTQAESQAYGVKVGQYIVPMISLATFYKLEETVISDLSVNSEKTLGYGDNRTYLSTSLTFANGAELNGGNDLEYISQKTASGHEIIKLPPHLWAGRARQAMRGKDLPKGSYFLVNYENPINTSVFGKMQVAFKPTKVNSGAKVIVGFEYLASTQALANLGLVSSN
jgi:hypothetical protein